MSEEQKTKIEDTKNEQEEGIVNKRYSMITPK